MKYDLIKASTKYTDMVGTVSFDFRGHHIEPFKKIFTEKGLDYEKYQVVSYKFGFYEATAKPFDVAKDTALLTAYTVSKEKVGETEQEIIEYASKHDNTVPIDYFYVKLKFQDLFDLLKRFNIMFNRDDVDRYHREGFYLENNGEHFLD